MYLYIIFSYLDKETATQYIPYLSFRPNRIVIAKLPLEEIAFESRQELKEAAKDIYTSTVTRLNKLFTGLKPLKTVLTKEDILYNNKYLALIDTLENKNEV